MWRTQQKGFVMRSILPLFAITLVAAVPAIAAETVPVSSFRQIELRGGGNILVRPAAVQRVTIVEGSSQFTRTQVDRDGRLRIEACNSQCPRNYRLRIVVDTPNVEGLAIRGGGTITAARGFRTQRNLATAIMGGGRLDARDIASTHVAAAVNGGGELLVSPVADLAAAVRGGGAIRYTGNPQVSSAISGGGSISRAR
jgi:hypothetical protein